MWESSGWISNLDPYGWFQWYCRFYLGRFVPNVQRPTPHSLHRKPRSLKPEDRPMNIRRTSDDARQISRFNGVAGPTGRFRNQLINKV
jgi:hypothetical protein